MSCGALIHRTIAAGLLLCLSIVATAAPGTDRALDVSIAVFDPGVPANFGSQRDLRVFPRIRDIEARILPFGLRHALVASGEWGAVRVVPENGTIAELLLFAVIEMSDGEQLALRVVATDASGRTWFDEVFAGRGSAEGGRDPATGDIVPVYAPVYVAIATRLRAFRDTLSDTELSRIREIALLRYGQNIAPSAFDKYLKLTADGNVELLSLPATDDPMVDRVSRVRSAEHIIVDAVDEKYQELYADIAYVYGVWREYQVKSRNYEEADARWVQEGPSDLRRGSYEALERSYDGYKWTRMTAQELDDMAVAFDNEVAPIIERVDSRIADLEDWVDGKYIEWNRLLEDLFSLETRLEE